MKKSMLTNGILFPMLCLSILLSCAKKDDPKPTTQQPGTVTPQPDPQPDPKPDEKAWIVVYRDVTLGDQENLTIGHFLQSSTGTVIPVEQTSGKEESLAMMFFTEYSANYAVLTFPGNATSAAAYDISSNRLFQQTQGGLNQWPQTKMNSGEITRPHKSGKDMTLQEFNELAGSNDWSKFDALFKSYNGGATDLSFVANYQHAANGDLYMLQLNNTVRAFIYVKNVVPSSANGGHIRFDMIIEGQEAYVPMPDAEVVQPTRPGKD